MVSTKSREYQIGKKIGHAFMPYVVIRLIIKGTKIIIKSGRVLLNFTMTNP
jgi:hypothetical protein